ncbi:MAG: hypothetical protein ACYTGH_20695, partial [Planctomycetota bacterium]
IDIGRATPDSFKLIDHLHYLYPDHPVIAISGGFYATEDLHPDTASVHYLEKPFEARTLLKTIHQLLPKVPLPALRPNPRRHATPFPG